MVEMLRPRPSARKAYTQAQTIRARALARQAVVDTIRASGGKLSHYARADIDRAAELIFAADPERYRAQAQAQLDLTPGDTL